MTRTTIAVAVGLSWAFVSLRKFIEVPDIVGVVAFSLALALLAPGAWLIANLSDRHRPVVVAAVVVALGGVVAGIGNFIEDGIGIKVFYVMYSLGILGVILGLIGLAVTLAVGRRFELAGLAAATFIGVFGSQEASLGFLVLAVWLAVAAGLRRG